VNTTKTTVDQEENDVHATSSPMSNDTANFNWLLSNFCKSVPNVEHTLVVSADGLLMAMSSELDRAGADQMAAIVSGMASLTNGAARQLRGGSVRQAIIEMDRRFLFVSTINDGSVLAVVADAMCDVGLVGYEMTLLVSRAEAAMTPQLIAEMRSMLPTGVPVQPRNVGG
jgi:predicted regulator of Ras-like GTPase activity (Roadblock/LC7/MglB family)